MHATTVLIFLGCVIIIYGALIWSIVKKAEPWEKMLIEERKRHRIP